MPSSLYSEAIQDASNDMYGTVQPAVEAITEAIKKVQPLLNSGTWQGPAATKWIDEWNGFYQTVLRLLDGMPEAEASVVSGVQRQMEQLETKVAHASEQSAMRSA